VTPLIALILSQAILAHLIRLNQRVGADPVAACLLQYVSATAIVAVWWGVSAGCALSRDEVVYGAVVGCMGISGYYLFNLGIQMSGVAIMQSVGRLSIAMPVAASIWLWGETPGVWQVVGLLLVALAVPLLARSNALKAPRRSPWKVPILVAHFAAMGTQGVAFKAFTLGQPEGTGPGFYLVMFASSAAVAIVPFVRRRRRFARRDVTGGLALGMVNLGCKVALTLSLAALPGIVVFPVSTAGTIVLSAFLSMGLWGERYGLRAIAGLLAALLAILAIQLGA